MIATVFLFRNGVVAVCDEHGSQMPDYQGPYEDVRDKIIRDAPATVDYNDYRLGEHVSFDLFRDFTPNQGVS